MSGRNIHLNPSTKTNKSSRISALAILPLHQKITLITTSAILLSSFGVKISTVQANPVSDNSQQTQEIARTTIIYVNPSTGSDSNGSGTQVAPLGSIAYALQQAPPDAVIQLAPGTYTQESGEVFPLVVKAGVTLRGDEPTNGQNTIIIGGGDVVSPTFARQNVTILAKNDSKISGVTVTNPNRRGTGIWIESTNPMITNSTFANSLRDGVFVTGTGNPQIINNIFVANDANGISVTKSARGEIRGNLFQRTGFGISISNRARPLVIENRIIENQDGVVVSHSATPLLRNNLIENNLRDGIVAIATALPDLGNERGAGKNIIRNNGRYDLYNATRENTILALGNDIDEAGISGLVEFLAATVNPPPTALVSETFFDVRGHWGQAYIEALASRKIFAGFEDGSFRPNDPVTRVQFATIIKNAFAPTPQRVGFQFVDVSSNFWGNEAIEIAYQGGFISGYPDGSFRPNEPITRLEAIAGLAKGLGVAAGDLRVLSVYADVNQIPDWASAAVAGATQRGLVVSYPSGDRLNPNLKATRAEVAAFIYQALVNAGKLEAIESPYVVSNP